MLFALSKVCLPVKSTINQSIDNGGMTGKQMFDSAGKKPSSLK
jgi:hypothetical protein